MSDTSRDEAYPGASHRLQAAALWRRWLARPKPGSPASGGAAIPPAVEAPPEVLRHYRHFSWVAHEQRLVALAFGFLLAGAGLVWSFAWRLESKPPVVVRAAPSLRESADAYYGAPEISYDAMAFFLNGCLPLLADDAGGEHPWLPLAQGLVAPDIYRRAERRLEAGAPDARLRSAARHLMLTGLDGMVADAKSGRVAATVHGKITVTAKGVPSRVFPWSARVLLQANPSGHLDPCPFYLLRLDPPGSPAASES